MTKPVKVIKLKNGSVIYVSTSKDKWKHVKGMTYLINLVEEENEDK